jgi:predicted kinase
MSSLILIAGLPGVGKSTLARTFTWGHTLLEADIYPGLYTYSPGDTPRFHGMEEDESGVPLIKRAHGWCIDQTRLCLERKAPAVVSNTFSMKWETRAYYEMAHQFSRKVTLIDLFDQGLTTAELVERTLHGVPAGAVEAMRRRWMYGQAKVWSAADLG